LTIAQQLEDLAVSAYIGIAGRFATADYMIAAAKMNSVGSRHAGYVRDSLVYNSFADGLDTNGMDPGITPEDAVAKTAKYFKSTLSTKHLPKS
jgi:hypothetical protein